MMEPSTIPTTLIGLIDASVSTRLADLRHRLAG